jgi:hypothetical protein
LAWIAASVVLVATTVLLCTLVFTGPGQAQATLESNLTGVFPTRITGTSSIIHMKAVLEETGAKASVVTDFYIQPSSGCWRSERLVVGTTEQSVRVFDGESVSGYDGLLQEAYGYSLSGYLASLAGEEYSPADPSADQIAGLVAQTREILSRSSVHEVSRETVADRQVTVYTDSTPYENSGIRIDRLVVDGVTGLPLEVQETNSAGRSVTSRTWSYETLPESAAQVVFAVDFPVGYEVKTDQDLPQLPYRAANTDSVSEEAGFDVFWLGQEYQGVPLSRVRILADGSVTVVYDFMSEPGKTRGPANEWRHIYIREWELAAHPEMEAFYDSNSQFEQVGEAAIGNVSGTMYTSGGSDKPMLVFKREGILVCVTQTPKADAQTLGDIAAALKEVLP